MLTEPDRPTSNDEGMIAPLSPEQHSGHYWQPFASYDFIQGRVSVMASLGEVMLAAASMPILFAQTNAGIGPVAMLSFNAQSPSPFVAGNGGFRASYAPALLRSHPFTAYADTSGKWVLGLDFSTGLINQDGLGTALFTPENTPSSDLKLVIEFFTRWQQGRTQALVACAELIRLELLEPIADSPGFLGLNNERFQSLDGTTISGLHASGALALCYAHQISKSHMQLLKIFADGGSALQKNADILPEDGSFLEALSEAILSEDTINAAG